ncbi:MAG: hypothetical protein D6744_09640 [Planctomycetota bacterium]|nr:MAG: hypothetical protein D6744_09640 [Planctomycetota bacterium]
MRVEGDVLDVATGQHVSVEAGATVGAAAEKATEDLVGRPIQLFVSKCWDTESYTVLQFPCFGIGSASARRAGFTLPVDMKRTCGYGVG